MPVLILEIDASVDRFPVARHLSIGDIFRFTHREIFEAVSHVISFRLSFPSRIASFSHDRSELLEAIGFEFVDKLWASVLKNMEF
jgi:hypothetical protein